MHGHRTNWDTGIVFKPRAKDFIKPSVRLQIKVKGSTGRSQEYNRSGVQVMTGAGVGMSDVLGVITGCAVEANIIGKHMIDAIHRNPFETEQLDTITEKMAVNIHQSSRLVPQRL
jgi:hypothetical protein